MAEYDALQEVVMKKIQIEKDAYETLYEGESFSAAQGEFNAAA